MYVILILEEEEEMWVFGTSRPLEGATAFGSVCGSIVRLFKTPQCQSWTGSWWECAGLFWECAGLVRIPLRLDKMGMVDWLCYTTERFLIFRACNTQL